MENVTPEGSSSFLGYYRFSASTVSLRATNLPVYHPGKGTPVLLFGLSTREYRLTVRYHLNEEFSLVDFHEC